ncbi:MAG: protein-glutamate O-methyltransferase CheR [Pseudomonadales bacterium]
MTEAQTLCWLNLVEQRTGIWFGRQPKILVAGVLRRMRDLKCHDTDEYLGRLSDTASGRLEWSQLVNEITVKETRFFRDPGVYDSLRGYLQQRMPRVPRGHSLDMWSVGSATGEEAYSMMMLAREVAELSAPQCFYGITGTDISSSALTIARQGVYFRRSLSGLSEQRLRCHFSRDTKDDGYQVVEEIRERVCFIRSNMLEMDNLPTMKMDVIFCLNVLVYFREKHCHTVLDGLVERLKPGGILVFGQNEAVSWKNSFIQKLPNRHINAFLRQ